MDYSFTTIGALIGMAVAIILIIKVKPATRLDFWCSYWRSNRKWKSDIDCRYYGKWSAEYDFFCTENYDFRYSGGNSY